MLPGRQKEQKDGVIIGGMVTGVVIFIAVVWLNQRPERHGGDSPATPVVQAPARAEEHLSPSTDTHGDAERTAAARDKRPPAALEFQFPGRPDIPPPTDPTWEFSRDDISTVGRGVELDFGNYAATVGDEIRVSVALSAPPLAMLTLIFRYDPEALEYVDGSAAFVGEFFRRGIEFYAVPERKTMALVAAGLPGQKNMLEANGEPVAVFTVRALKPGTTRFEPIGRGVSFTSAAGDDEENRITGGTFSISPSR